jgi:hypothetical protein
MRRPHRKAPTDLGPIPLHDFAFIVLGVPLFDDTNLDALADAGRRAQTLGISVDGSSTPGQKWDRLTRQSHCGVLTLAVD